MIFLKNLLRILAGIAGLVVILCLIWYLMFYRTAGAERLEGTLVWTSSYQYENGA